MKRIAILALVAALTGCAPVISKSFMTTPLTDAESNQERTMTVVSLGGGYCSGVIVSADGHILTSSLMASEPDGMVFVHDQEAFWMARTIAVDPKSGLSLLKVEVEGHPFAYLDDGANSGPPPQDVYFVGVDDFSESPLVTRGYIRDRKPDLSSIKGDVIKPKESFLTVSEPEFDAMVGTPVFSSRDGRLVGMVISSGTAVFNSRLGGKVVRKDTIQISVPIKTIRAFLRRNNVPINGGRK